MSHTVMSHTKKRKVAAAGAKNDSDFEYDDIVDSDY